MLKMASVRRADSKIPYISSQLRHRIVSGAIEVGDCIPSGRVLAKEYGVSYMTARRAVEDLVAEGMLEQRPGSGVYVKRAVSGRHIGILFLHVNHLLDVGSLTSVSHFEEGVGTDVGLIRPHFLPTPYPGADEVVEELRAMRIGVLGVIGHRMQDLPLLQAISTHFPVVLVGKDLPGLDVSCARPDQATAASQIVSYVESRGRSRVAGTPIITGHPSHFGLASAVQRVLRQRDFLVDDDWWMPQSEQGEGVYHEAEPWLRRVFANDGRPDTLVLIHVTLEYVRAVVQQLTEMGLEVGKDIDVIRVAGGGDRERILGQQPRLPTVSVHLGASARAAGQLIAEMTAGRKRPNRVHTMLIQPDFIA